MPITIIPREAWGAEEPKIRRPLTIPVTNVAEDHFCPITYNKKSYYPPCLTQEECAERVRLIQKMAFKKNQSDLNYNFLIGGDGNVYEGRGWNTLLTEDFRWDGISIGYIGHYTTEEPVPENMKAVFDELVEYGKKRLLIKEDAYVFQMNREQMEFDDD